MHPHSLVVLLVIVLLSIALVTDFLYLISQKENFWRTASYLLVLGTISAIVAVITGNQAHEVVEIPVEMEKLVHIHQNSGQITMWVFILLTIMRFVFSGFDLFKKPVKWVYYVLSAVSIIFLFRTGLLGGEMVYIHGLGMKESGKPPVTKPSFEE